jgi:hypothetical protein
MAMPVTGLAGGEKSMGDPGALSYQEKADACEDHSLSLPDPRALVGGVR